MPVRVVDDRQIQVLDCTFSMFHSAEQLFLLLRSNSINSLNSDPDKEMQRQISNTVFRKFYAAHDGHSFRQNGVVRLPGGINKKI